MGRSGQPPPPLPDLLPPPATTPPLPVLDTYTPHIEGRGTVCSHDPKWTRLKTQALPSHQVSGDTPQLPLSPLLHPHLTHPRTHSLGNDRHWDAGCRECALFARVGNARARVPELGAGGSPLELPLGLWRAGVLTSRAPGPGVWLLQGGIQVRQPDYF